jgi:hypothetical protein
MWRPCVFQYELHFPVLFITFFPPVDVKKFGLICFKFFCHTYYKNS